MIYGFRVWAILWQYKWEMSDAKIKWFWYSHPTLSISFVINSNTKSIRNLWLLIYFFLKTVFKLKDGNNNTCLTYSNVGTTVIDNVIRYFAVLTRGFIKWWILRDPFIYLLVSSVCWILLQKIYVIMIKYSNYIEYSIV